MVLRVVWVEYGVESGVGGVWCGECRQAWGV